MTESWEPTQTTVDATTPTSVDGAERREWSATTLDDAASATTLDGPAASFVAIQLPPGMAADYELLERLGGGGEAVVHRAHDMRHDRDVAIKVYLGMVPQARFEIGDDTHLRYFPHEHAVDLYERRSEAGSYIEVMEYCPDGTLEDYAAGRSLGHDEIAEVVAEIAAAIDAMGTWRHGDVKPQNILVRSRNPLDLVLTDFGLTQNLGERARVTSVGNGTRLYQPPGTGHSARKSDDWWALGIIVAELAAGYHPFADLFGASFNEEVVRDFLIHNPVPTDHLTDPRIQHLVRGLLARNPDERFGYDEVRQWLDGGLPPLPVDVSANSATLTPLNFQGTLYRDFASLAEAIRTSPQSSEAGKGVTLRSIVEWTEGTPLHSHARRIEAKQSALKGRLTAALLATLLAGDGRAMFSGVDLTSPEGLVEVGGNLELLAEIHENYAIERFSELLDNAELAKVAKTWRDYYERAYRLVPKPVSGGSVVLTIIAHAWRLAIDSAYDDELRNAADVAAKTEDISLVDWLKPLLDARNEPAAAIAILASMPAAEGEISKRQEERRREQAEEQRRLEQERERREQEEEQARQKREQEAAQEAKIRAQRRRQNLCDLACLVVFTQVLWVIWILLRGWAKGEALSQLQTPLICVGIGTIVALMAVAALVADREWFNGDAVATLNFVALLAGFVEAVASPPYQNFWWPFSVLRGLGLDAVPYLYAPVIELLLTAGYALLMSWKPMKALSGTGKNNSYSLPVVSHFYSLIPLTPLLLLLGFQSPQVMGDRMGDVAEVAVLLATVTLVALPLGRTEAFSILLLLGFTGFVLAIAILVTLFIPAANSVLYDFGNWLWSTVGFYPPPGSLGWWLTTRPVGMVLTLDLLMLTIDYVRRLIARVRA